MECRIVGMIRVQKRIILEDLNKKLVLLVGPRQCGKTWLAKDIAKSFKNSLYLNYDNAKDREIINNQSWLENIDLLILDELHKMPGWKNYLKGIFDTKPESLRLLVTGTASLDIYDKLGDSLAGRYFRHRLMPISLSELAQSNSTTDIEKLLERGGFPEPYFASDNKQAERWRMQYINSLLSTDIFEIDKVHNIKAMRVIFELLKYRVGSPISMQSLAEDAAVSPTTVRKYIRILEALFIIFVVTPYSRDIARSLLKEPKIYFFDTGLVEGNGAKLENLVAVSLLKHVYAKIDIEAENYNLQYLRTKDGQEVDFALVKDEKIETMIEVKFSDSKVSKSIAKFHEKYGYGALQLVKSIRTEYKAGGVNILNAEKYLTNLYL